MNLPNEIEKLIVEYIPKDFWLLSIKDDSNEYLSEYFLFDNKKNLINQLDIFLSTYIVYEYTYLAYENPYRYNNQMLLKKNKIDIDYINRNYYIEDDSIDCIIEDMKNFNGKYLKCTVSIKHLENIQFNKPINLQPVKTP